MAAGRPVADFQILVGDALETLRGLQEASVDCCVTSPPYFGLRDYGVPGQMGLEPTPEAFVEALVQVMREVRRVLKPTGTLWLNIGDGYTSGNRGYRAPDKKNPARAMSVRPDTPEGLKPKDLIGIPWMVAFALRADGWWLRRDIIWSKPNPMPESPKDRPTTAHEYLFLLTKSPRYFYDVDAIREPAVTASREGERRSYTPGCASSYDMGGGHQGQRGSFAGLPLNPLGRNRRSVWTIPTKPFKGAHFATFPEGLVEPCILAGCPEGGLVLDPFAGAGTTGVVALQEFRRFLGIELNPAFASMAEHRIAAAVPGPLLFKEGTNG